MARIKKGDTVAVLSGKEKGKSGKVLQVWPVKDVALIERVNLMTHYERKSQQNPSGGMVRRETPLPLSVVALLCPKCRKPARIGWQVTPTGEKRRLCRRCQEPLS